MNRIKGERERGWQRERRGRSRKGGGWSPGRKSPEARPLQASRAQGGDLARGALPLQRGLQALGNPGVIPQRLRNDHGIFAAEADCTPEIQRAQQQKRDLSADCMEGPAEGAGCWGGLLGAILSSWASAPHTLGSGHVFRWQSPGWGGGRLLQRLCLIAGQRTSF